MKKCHHQYWRWEVQSYKYYSSCFIIVCYNLINDISDCRVLQVRTAYRVVMWSSWSDSQDVRYACNMSSEMKLRIIDSDSNSNPSTHLANFFWILIWITLDKRNQFSLEFTLATWKFWKNKMPQNGIFSIVNNVSRLHFSGCDDAKSSSRLHFPLLGSCQ